jgi:predicted ArsR family transcriptional regulator
MIDLLGTRQQELLTSLLKNKAGLTVDALAQQLGITRNAIRQHLSTLENDGLVAPGETRPSGGRPQQLHVLTDKGRESFPRQYAWFAQLMVESIKQEVGSDGLGERLDGLGSAIGNDLLSQHPALQDRQQRVEKLTQLMEGMGYAATSSADESQAPVIEADNCVFHHLAINHPEVCRFDLALLGTFTDSRVEHQECMANGGRVCRFRFTPRK